MHMKITKRIPLKPRGRAEEKKHLNRDAIREAYEAPQREVQIIPAKRDLISDADKKRLRVCAYCRVSTDEEAQEGSYELQVQHYTQVIQSNPDWEFVGIYADKGISGTSTLHRVDFQRMIADCRAGKIDLIITKQVSRFARNVLDSLQHIRLLRQLDPPVGILFEAEGLNTLDKTSEMIITVLSLVAQSESEQKSNSIKWAYRKRCAKGVGIKPNWALLGYDTDEHGNWIIVEEEAEVVRTIYTLYLDGYSTPAIADLLTKSGIPTVMGLSVWSSGSVLGILRNEKYCGDALCQKTVTIDFFTHKSIKNDGHEPQYFIEGHHPAIIDKADWLTAQRIRTGKLNIRRSKSRRKPKVLMKGCLAGFFILDTSWDETYVDSLFAQTPVTDTQATAIPLEDEHFTIEKE